MVISLIFVILFVINILPVYATDFSGYVEAEWSSEWEWRDGTGTYEKYMWVNPESGKMQKRITQHYLKNTADYPLTEAIYVIGIVKVTLKDGALNVVYETEDPEEIAQLVNFKNSDEMWNGNYVFWLGTIQPGHSKRLTWNMWYGELLTNWEHTWVISFDLTMQGLWYLPT